MGAATSSSAGPVRAGSEPAGSAGLAPKPARPTRAVAAVARKGPNVMCLQAELDEAGTLDLRWRYIGEAAAAWR